MARPKQKQERATARFSYAGLDRVIHERARLSILTSLSTNPKGLLFTDLKGLCALTDGNLSRHLQILQEAGLVEIWKGHQKNRPQTLCRLTDEGRERFLGYVAVLEGVVSDALTASKFTQSTEDMLAGGWEPA